METERERNRRLYPEMGIVADFYRGAVAAAWVADKDGEVITGRCPADEYTLVWFDADKLLRMNATLDQHYAGMKPAPKSWAKRIDRKNAGLV